MRLNSASDSLERWTGWDAAEWVTYVQEQIAASFRENPKDPDHPLCDQRDWLDPVVDKVIELVEETQPSQRYDGNIRTAVVLSVILGMWATRITRAKSYDPNRPLPTRRRALKAHQQYIIALLDAATNESQDVDFFPTQEWNPPYGPSATGGTFR